MTIPIVVVVVVVWKWQNKSRLFMKGVKRHMVVLSAGDSRKGLLLLPALGELAPLPGGRNQHRHEPSPAADTTFPRPLVTDQRILPGLSGTV